MKVLITGATGLLGPYLMEAFPGSVGVSRDGPSDFKGDLTKKGIVELLMVYRPDLVIHAAAATNVDWCQKNPQEAYAANVTATRNIVQFMPKDSRLVYISTDMVYAGPGPHAVNGPNVNPLNIYGMTKFFGELEAEKHPNPLIVRTNLYGRARTPRASSLVDFLIHSLRERNPVGLYTDMLFSPLHTVTLASLIKKLVAEDRTGTINLGSKNGISKADFALLLARYLNLPTETTALIEAPTENRAPRPKDARMVTEVETPTIEDDLAEACRSWQI